MKRIIISSILAVVILGVAVCIGFLIGLRSGVMHERGGGQGMSADRGSQQGIGPSTRDRTGSIYNQENTMAENTTKHESVWQEFRQFSPLSLGVGEAGSFEGVPTLKIELRRVVSDTRCPADPRINCNQAGWATILVAVTVNGATTETELHLRGGHPDAEHPPEPVGPKPGSGNVFAVGDGTVLLSTLDPYPTSFEKDSAVYRATFLYQAHTQ